MRIAFFSNAYKPAMTGVVTSISIFRQGLIAMGHEVHVFAPNYDHFSDRETNIHRIPSLELPVEKNHPFVWPLKSLLDSTVYEVSPDIIHSHHPILMGDLAATFSKELNVPLVFTFHSQYEKYAQIYTPVLPELAVRVTEEIVARYLMRCSHLIVPTESIREYVIENYGVSIGVTVVPTPLDLNQFRSARPDRVREMFGLEEAEVLLYLGRLAREKQIDFMLRAFSLISQERRNARLMIVGEGPDEDRIRSTVRMLGLEGKVFFVGRVRYERVQDYYAAADIFLFSSSTETQGLVILEAMASGLPIVAVRTSGVQDVLCNGGGVMTEEDEGEFAQAVLSLLNDDRTRDRLSMEAVAAAESYGVSETTKKLVSAYEIAIESI